jgi:TolB protein
LLTAVVPIPPNDRKPGLTPLEGIQSGGRAALASDVYPSFVALRRAVIAASGHDFLAHLSEASRAVDFQSDSASYASWHKAGRAFDTLFSFSAGGRQVLYIVPEALSGRLFWRLYLRAQRQDGSQGVPLTSAVFNPGTRTLAPPPTGYFVDFTNLAAQYGWRRIAAQERDNFNWRSALLALEYWHFERRDGLSWYDAMALVHNEQLLKRLFSVEKLKAVGVQSFGIANLGLPWAKPIPPINGPIVPRSGPR